MGHFKGHSNGQHTEWALSAKIIFTASLYYGELLFKNFQDFKRNGDFPKSDCKGLFTWSESGSESENFLGCFFFML